MLQSPKTLHVFVFCFLVLFSSHHEHLLYMQALYGLGARKVIVTAVGQIGCIPYQLARYDGNVNGSRCNEEINSAISLFNTGLKRLVDRFNRGLLPGARFVYLDSFQSSQDLAENARTYGRRVACSFNTTLY